MLLYTWSRQFYSLVYFMQNVSLISAGFREHEHHAHWLNILVTPPLAATSLVTPPLAATSQRTKNAWKMLPYTQKKTLELDS